MNTSYKVKFWEIRPNKSKPRPGKPAKAISVSGVLHLRPWGLARSPAGWDDGGDDPAGGAVA